MTFAQSLAMAVPAARQATCNALMEALGRGPDTFSVPIRDKATLVRVAYVAHTYDDDLIDLFVNQIVPPGVTLARLQSFGFATVAAARTAAGFIRFKVAADRQARANVLARLDQDGWEIEPQGSIR